MKQLQVYSSLGTTFSVGWERDDLPMLVHVFANAAPGERFDVQKHWPCKVCESHGYTEVNFHAQIGPALERGP
jgi:hypothetical protein